jgi:hypothetical protein
MLQTYLEPTLKLKTWRVALLQETKPRLLTSKAWMEDYSTKLLNANYVEM